MYSIFNLHIISVHKSHYNHFCMLANRLPQNARSHSSPLSKSHSHSSLLSKSHSHSSLLSKPHSHSSLLSKPHSHSSLLSKPHSQPPSLHTGAQSRQRVAMQHVRVQLRYFKNIRTLSHFGHVTSGHVATGNTSMEIGVRIRLLHPRLIPQRRLSPHLPQICIAMDAPYCFNFMLRVV